MHGRGKDDEHLLLAGEVPPDQDYEPEAGLQPSWMNSDQLSAGGNQGKEEKESEHYKRPGGDSSKSKVAGSCMDHHPEKEVARQGGSFDMEIVTTVFRSLSTVEVCIKPQVLSCAQELSGQRDERGEGCFPGSGPESLSCEQAQVFRHSSRNPFSTQGPDP